MVEMNAVEGGNSVWNSGEQESVLTMEDSGIDSDQKQQQVQDEGRLFTVSYSTIRCSQKFD
jgi:adenine deaminase